MTSNLNELGFNRIRGVKAKEKISEFEQRKVEILKANNNFDNLRNQINPEEFDLFLEAIITSLEVYDPEIKNKKVWAISYSKVLVNGISKPVFGVNMPNHEHTVAPGSTCAEHGMISEANKLSRTAESEFETIVVVTIGQDKPLQVCPNCRPKFTKCSPNTKFILASLNPTTFEVEQFGVHSHLELQPNNPVFRIDFEKSELYRKRLFEYLVKKTFKLLQSELPKPTTADKLTEYNYSVIIYECPNRLFRNSIKLAGNWYAHVEPYEKVKGTSASPSPAVISFKAVENLFNTRILGVVNFTSSKNDLHKPVHYDPQAVALFTTNDEKKLHPDLLFAIPNQQAPNGFEVVEAKALHPYSAVRVTFDRQSYIK